MAKTHPEQSPRRVAKSPLYTRAGDKGETSLFGGQRVAKDNLRVGAYGDIDELNSVIGVAVAFLRQRRPARLLETIQNELFNVGAELASPAGRSTPGGSEGRAKRKRDRPSFVLSADKVAELERWIDEYDAKVPPLKTFILPAGSGAAVFLHLARTVCRRAERAVAKLAHSEEVNPNVLAYLNRLSDLLFALARYVNKAQGGRERPWRKGSG